MEPIMFGEKTPPGRVAGDCYLCGGDADVCDCQLSYTEAEGTRAGFVIGEDDHGAYLGVTIDGELGPTSRMYRVGR